MSTWSKKTYLSDSRVTNISKSFTHKMAVKTSWHRYGTKLHHCHTMYSCLANQQLVVIRGGRKFCWRKQLMCRLRQCKACLVYLLTLYRVVLFCCILHCLLFLICIEFVYLYFPVLFCLSVSVKWLAVNTASEMTYIVSSGALNSTPTNYR